jgi:membrane protein DedA with SNARE-associated domain
MMPADAFSFLGHQPLWPIYAILAVVACLKYALPFIPGDMILIMSVFWIGVKDGSWLAVVGAVTLGGTLGALIAFYWGSSVQRLLLRSRKAEKMTASVRAILKRWGFWPLLFNRFIPFIRPFLYPTAGLMEMRPGPVFLSALFGNLLFGFFLAALGYSAGQRYARMNSLYHLYQLWLGGFVVVLLFSLALFVYMKGKAVARRRPSAGNAKRDLPG